MGVCFSAANSGYHTVSTEIIEDDEITQPPPSHYPTYPPSPESDDSIDVVDVTEIPSNIVLPATKTKWHLRLRFLKKK